MNYVSAAARDINTDDEMTAVAEILIDHLHATENDYLQAALWRVLEYSAQLERKVLAAQEVLG